MQIIGIDPGLSGGVAVLDEECLLVAVTDLPVIRDASALPSTQARLASWLMSITGPKRAVVERVSAMPKQGVASSFKFGMGFGSVIATVQVLQIPLELVTPSTWKRDLNLAKDKKAALHRARMMWPSAPLELEKHDGRAEALLIAYWYLQKGKS